VLYQRLKVPPAINQFTQTADKNLATEVFKLLNKYRPETHVAKRQRLRAEAEKKAASPDAKHQGPKPFNVKYGINHITALIENKKALLVVIAHDVDPIEVSPLDFPQRYTSCFYSRSDFKRW
jgi:large subunit ribosomal protein L7Ae